MSLVKEDVTIITSSGLHVSATSLMNKYIILLRLPSWDWNNLVTPKNTYIYVWVYMWVYLCVLMCMCVNVCKSEWLRERLWVWVIVGRSSTLNYSPPQLSLSPTSLSYYSLPHYSPLWFLGTKKTPLSQAETAVLLSINNTS